MDVFEPGVPFPPLEALNASSPGVGVELFFSISSSLIALAATRPFTISEINSSPGTMGRFLSVASAFHFRQGSPPAASMSSRTMVVESLEFRERVRVEAFAVRLSKNRDTGFGLDIEMKVKGNQNIGEDAA